MDEVRIAKPAPTPRIRNQPSPSGRGGVLRSSEMALEMASVRVRVSEREREDQEPAQSFGEGRRPAIKRNGVSKSKSGREGERGSGTSPGLRGGAASCVWRAC